MDRTFRNVHRRNITKLRLCEVYTSVKCTQNQLTVQEYIKPVNCTSVNKTSLLVNNVHKTGLLVNNERNVHRKNIKESTGTVLYCAVLCCTVLCCTVL